MTLPDRKEIPKRILSTGETSEDTDIPSARKSFQLTEPRSSIAREYRYPNIIICIISARVKIGAAGCKCGGKGLPSGPETNPKPPDTLMDFATVLS